MTVSVVDSLGKHVSSSYYPEAHEIKITKQYASEEGYFLVMYMPIVLRERDEGNSWKDTAPYAAVGLALSRYIPNSFIGHVLPSQPADSGPDRWPDSTDESNVNEAGESLCKALWKLRGTIPSGILDRAALKGWAETQELYRDPHYQKLFVEQLVMELPQGERDRVRRFFSDRNILPK